MDGELCVPADRADTQRHTLSTAELSKLTGVSESTIRRLKDADRIPFSQPGGHRSRVLFPPDALERRRADRDESSLGQREPNHMRPDAVPACAENTSSK